MSTRKPRLIRYEKIENLGREIKCQGPCGKTIKGPVVEALIFSRGERGNIYHFCQECARSYLKG